MYLLHLFLDYSQDIMIFFFNHNINKLILKCFQVFNYNYKLVPQQSLYHSPEQTSTSTEPVSLT
jgi:hypothetical protein